MFQQFETAGSSPGETMPRALKDRPLDCLESLIRKSESKMNVITEGVKLQVCSAVGLGS